MSSAPAFDAGFREQLRSLLRWRRDVRSFNREPLQAGTLERMLDMACLAPSVGLSEPWRFVVVADPERRSAVRACFEQCNADALREQRWDRAALYARLKLAGLDDAPAHVAVFADRTTEQGHGLGRLTMPETIEYSAVMAAHTIWLTARAEGIGVGWVSILDPAMVSSILDVPDVWTFVGYLCIGYPADEHDRPLLEREGWEERRPADRTIIYR